MTPTVEEIVKGLTKAQSRVLVHGLQGRDTIATLRALQRIGLMKVKYADPNGDAWRLTPLGLSVRTYLESMGDGNG